MPASARLESPGKVLRASRKWLFGCPRHCSTFLDADPAAQEPFQRTGLGQLFPEPAATALARQQQPRGAAASPRDFPASRRAAAGRRRGRCPGSRPCRGRVSSAPRRHFQRVSCKCSSSLALLRGPRLHARGGQGIASARVGTDGPGPRACGPVALPWSHSSEPGHNVCPPAETPGPSPDPAPSGSVPRPTERAGEEAPRRSASRINQPRRETRLRSAPLCLPYPAFLFPGYLALKKEKKKIAPVWQRLSYCFPDKQRSGWELPSLLGLLGVPGSL